MENADDQQKHQLQARKDEDRQANNVEHNAQNLETHVCMG
jgi:hypothetical protein